MCEIASCENSARGRHGLCNAHRLKLQRRGDATLQIHRRYDDDATCEETGCDSRPLAKGLCRSHYDARNRRVKGIPERKLRERSSQPRPKARPKTDLERFWEKVNKTESCWLWTATRTKMEEGKGYGLFSINGGSMTAHRFSYELVHGPIPKELVIDHLCRTRACVNPDHLEVVTPYENMMRGVGFAASSKQQTHCKRGHPLSGDDVRIVNGGRSRRCLACRRERHREGSNA